MAGTKAGGKKAAARNKELYGEDYYSKIGSVGGKLGTTGGFYANRELASIAGRKGGKISKRGKSVKQDSEHTSINGVSNSNAVPLLRRIFSSNHRGA